MREDSSKSTKFTGSNVWKSQRYNETFLVAPADANLDKDDQKSKLKFVSNSLSGDERNRLFMRHQENFADVSLLSGTDDLADARSHSLLDYDNDGWVDIERRHRSFVKADTRHFVISIERDDRTVSEQMNILTLVDHICPVSHERNAHVGQ